jgi:hypothetical protein
MKRSRLELLLGDVIYDVVRCGNRAMIASCRHASWSLPASAGRLG